MDNKITQINQLFFEINKQIMLQLEYNVDNQDLIIQNFELIKNLLNDIESIPNEHDKLLRNYHKLCAAYNRSIGNLKEAIEHDKALKRKNVQNNHSSTTIPYLSFLKEMITFSETNSEKSDYNYKIALYYHKKAKNEENTIILKSLPYWQYAKKYYQHSLSFNRKNYESASGYTHCLLKLSKFELAIKFLHKYSHENFNDYFLLEATALRRMFEYSKAKIEIEKAFELNPTSVEIQNEMKLIDNLIKNNKESKIIDYSNPNGFTNESNRKQKETYKILSIDGGGIRGIIPAFWACEIEKRAHMPISNLFNMLSGTSTGGIIAAGLSVPKRTHDGDTPRFRAYDILDMYVNKSASIFSRERAFHIFGSKYSDKGRYDLFNEYFPNKTLSQSLTDLVIPTAYEESLYTTYLFNRYDAKQDPYRNDTIVDALMATTAAPTYFPSYKINGKGLFNDGGVHVNNPSSVACQEALRYGVQKEDLFLLSLGTGANIPEALSQNSLRGYLFWASHLQDVALQAQIGNTDLAMYNALGGKYERFQVWFENPISLDDYGSKGINFLLESANQYIEELDCSEKNLFNKLVESLVKGHEF
jgi:predicted acylesterase/phospholipase RssA